MALNKVSVERFGDGELNINLGMKRDVEGKLTIFVQPMSPPVNENLVELLLEIEAIKGLGAEEIIAVVPYFGYSRQVKEARKG